MLEVASPQDLQEFICSEEDVFETLNDPDRGVAYVKLPKGINPQALIDRYAGAMKTPDSIPEQNEQVMHEKQIVFEGDSASC